MSDIDVFRRLGLKVITDPDCPPGHVYFIPNSVSIEELGKALRSDHQRYPRKTERMRQAVMTNKQSSEYTWKRRLTRWFQADESREFLFVNQRRINRLPGVEYTLSNGLTIFAETLSQWGL